MANEKVSQMVGLSANEMAGNDLFLVVDTSAKESKRLTASDLVTYVQESGSFIAVSATTADTASYIDPDSVGLIPSASYSITSSHALYARTASVLANGTASYALMAGNVSGTIANANTASFLQYNAGRNNGTSSRAMTLHSIERVYRFLSTQSLDTVDMCRLANWSYLVHLAVSGLHCACTKTYLLGLQYTSPGLSVPYAVGSSNYNGWFTVKPLMTPHTYPYEQSTYTDFDLEASQSAVHQLTLRVRTNRSISGATPTASLYIWGLDSTSSVVTVLSHSITQSTVDLPAWGSAFATMQGNYRFIVSGSLTTTQPITASLLFGTASRCITASYLDDAAGASIASSSHADVADTASFVDVAQTSSVSTSASFLEYTPGVNNGTSSFSMASLNSETASFVRKNPPNVVKAWAQIEWYSGYTAPVIVDSYNISEFNFLDRHYYGTSNTNPYLWGVVFESALPTSSYIVLGNAHKIPRAAIQGSPLACLNNEWCPKTTSSFSCSFSVEDSYYNTWFVADADSNWYSEQTGTLMFTVYGNPS